MSRLPHALSVVPWLIALLCAALWIIAPWQGGLDLYAEATSSAALPHQLGARGWVQGVARGTASPLGLVKMSRRSKTTPFKPAAADTPTELRVRTEEGTVRLRAPALWWTGAYKVEETGPNEEQRHVSPGDPVAAYVTVVELDPLTVTPAVTWVSATSREHLLGLLQREAALGQRGAIALPLAALLLLLCGAALWHDSHKRRAAAALTLIPLPGLLLWIFIPPAGWALGLTSALLGGLAFATPLFRRPPRGAPPAALTGHLPLHKYTRPITLQRTLTHRSGPPELWAWRYEHGSASAPHSVAVYLAPLSSPPPDLLVYPRHSRLGRPEARASSIPGDTWYEGPLILRSADRAGAERWLKPQVRAWLSARSVSLEVVGGALVLIDDERSGWTEPGITDFEELLELATRPPR